MASFGQRLRQLRGGRSQKEVADALRIPPTTLSSLESQRNIPRGEVLQKLSDFFRVPITYFYAESQPVARATDAARQYLKQLRQPAQGADTVATQSNTPLDESTRQKLADLIRRKNAEVSNK
jgi:transcriptional regulator with XRE-family HTH domain